MPAPTLPAASVDLSDAEFAELDDLLAGLPEDLQPMDAVMLDGYLCGVLAQPTPIPEQEWLPWVFDAEGRGAPEGAAGERIRALTARRCAALNRALVEDGWFDPLILEAADGEAGGGDVDEAGLPSGLSEVSRPLLPWVVGFQEACSRFPALLELDEPDVMSALARVFRHVPAETAEARELVATLDRELPLATLDDAIEELVAAVADLADLTRDARYHVDTVRRAAPKVGRNDPCPCGSGRKFKQCHGG